ncbi:MAG: ribosome maturation factor RimP [Blastocatellia bacterium]|nr:ribosome maturation factor RimP [Blastocatellia bacterium]
MKVVLDKNLYSLVEKVVKAEGFEFVHCEFVGGRNSAVLRVYIDKPGGITHSDCSYISQQLGTVLDVEDLISGHYTLEISSPGIDRGLYKKEDYTRFAGNKVRLKTNQAIEGSRNFKGRLETITDDGVVTLVDKTGKHILIPFDLIQSAKIEVDVEELFRQAEQKQ